MKAPWVFEENGFFVDWTGSAAVVFRPSRSGTHPEIDSAYEGRDGIALAIARALYLSRGPGRHHASEAMRLAAAVA